VPVALIFGIVIAQLLTVKTVPDQETVISHLLPSETFTGCVEAEVILPLLSTCNTGIAVEEP